MDKLPPIHPGEVLLEDFMKPLGLSQYRVAKDIGVPALRISQIVRGQRSITADTALRLGRYFGTSAAVFDKKAGVLASYGAPGHNLIRQGPLLNIWRAGTDNDGIKLRGSQSQEWTGWWGPVRLLVSRRRWGRMVSVFTVV